MSKLPDKSHTLKVKFKISSSKEEEKSAPVTNLVTVYKIEEIKHELVD